MKEKTLKFKHKGKKFSERVAVPETLEEAYTHLGEKQAMFDFEVGYLARMKKEIIGVKPRKKRFVKVDTEKLDPETLAMLREKGLEI